MSTVAALPRHGHPPRILHRVAQTVAIGATLLISLAALAPATWLDFGLNKASQGTLMLGNAQGRIWQGKGTLQAILPQGDAVTLAPVTWTLPVVELITGRLHLRMLSEQTGSPMIDATLNRQGVQINSLRLELPAALLGAVSPTLREAELAGNLSLRSDATQLAADGMTGKIELQWHDASSSLTAVRPLGSYNLILGGQGQNIRFNLTTLRGDLALNGSGDWQAGKRLNFDGTATPSEAKRQELVPLLRIFGREIRPGVYKLELDPNVGAV